jgi:hypothetical protein
VLVGDVMLTGFQHTADWCEIGCWLEPGALSEARAVQ